MAKATTLREHALLSIGSDANRGRGAEAVDIEAELGAEEAARLLAAIDEADAANERGDAVEAHVVMQELHQILHG